MDAVQIGKRELENNFLANRVMKINKRLCDITDKDKIIVWGAGRHTDYLFKYTDILKYNISVIDRRISGSYFGFNIMRSEDINWNEITAVVISSFRFAEEIFLELREKYQYKGEVVQFYESDEIWEFWQLNKSMDSCFWGDFASFKEATSVAEIWNESETLEQELKVLRTVLQNQIDWYWTQWLQKNIFRIYMRNHQKHMYVIDFGGGFGQEYFNDRDIFSCMECVKWVVVDQKEHISYGQRYLQSEELKFVENIEEAVRLTEGKCSFFILGSVLQYIDKWKEFLADIFRLNIPYLLINRQSMAERERICIQNMGAYNSSSVFRIFKKQELFDYISDQYELIDSTKYKGNGAIFSDLFVEENCWLFRKKAVDESTI